MSNVRINAARKTAALAATRSSLASILRLADADFQLAQTKVRQAERALSAFDANPSLDPPV